MNVRKYLNLVLFFALPIFAVKAQVCAELMDFYKSNKELEYVSYDKKEKVSTSMKYKTLRTEVKNDTSMVWLLLKAYDNKNNEISQNEVPIKCYKDMLIIDMRSAIPAMPVGGQDAQQDIRMEIKGDDLAFPSDAKIGQTLPDAEMELTTYMGTMRLLSNKYAMRNRKVEGNERVTTPAGSFDCIKYSYDFEYNFLGKRTSRTEYWFKPGLGMVKTVNYDKKGGVESRTELAKIK